MKSTAEKHLLFLFTLLSLLLSGCDGFRSLRADINLNENRNYDFKSALRLIDDVSQKHGLQCSPTVDDHFRSCGLYSVNLTGRVNAKTDVFSIDLREFGPVGATNVYKSLHDDISDVIRTSFKKESVLLNPQKCTSYLTKRITVKLHDRRPKVLYFVPWSIEPEFTNAVADIGPIAEKHGMKGSGCYAMNREDRCERYIGGDYIGVWESVRLDLKGDSSSLTLHIDITDMSCHESDLTKMLYAEILDKVMAKPIHLNGK